MPNFFRRQAGTMAQLPAGCRVYAVGDIHGCNDLLSRLLAMIRRDLAGWDGSVTMVFVGDYVDRGPDTRGAIDTLLELSRSSVSTKFLRGNHDQALLDFLATPTTYPAWRDFGAAHTLRSYDVEPPVSDNPHELFQTRTHFIQQLPLLHRQFLQGLKPSFSLGDYFFTHAGVRPGVALDRQSPRDLMWIREEFLDSSENFGKIVVHGHSPSRSPVRAANRIGIDTEAYSSGKLTAAVLEGARCRFLQT